MLSNSEISELFSKYKNMIYRIAFSYCKSKDMADDILQEVFLRFIKKDPVFDSNEHEKAWFIRVTINCCKTNLASFWLRKTSPLEESSQLTFQQEEESELFYAVMALPNKYRIVIHLYYYENYSTQEVAELLSLSQSAVNTQLFRARKLLKESLSTSISEYPLLQTKNLGGSYGK